MITVHHLNNSRSQRVLWLLEELGLPYEVKRYQRNPMTLRAPAALQAVHPLGKAPTITDGPVTLAESGAILEYLIERAENQGRRPRLAPAHGTPERLRYSYWMHYAEGSAMLPLVLRLIFEEMPRQPMPVLARPVVRALASRVIESFVQPQVEAHLEYIEGELGKSRWFAGEHFTAADIQMSFPIEMLDGRGGLDANRVNLRGYLDRIRERPAYQRAIERGGPYALSRLIE
jgi:glutathione S-transferase